MDGPERRRVLVKDGQPFTFVLRTNQGNDERKKVAEIIQASLKDLGVGVEIRVIEWASFLKEYIKKKHFEAIVLGWGIRPIPISTRCGTRRRWAPRLNRIGYANPEVDELLEKGRPRASGRAEKVLPTAPGDPRRGPADRLPLLPGRPTGGLLAVRGIAPSPNGIRYNFTEWFVPAPLHGGLHSPARSRPCSATRSGACSRRSAPDRHHLRLLPRDPPGARRADRAWGPATP